MKVSIPLYYDSYNTIGEKDCVEISGDNKTIQFQIGDRRVSFSTRDLWQTIEMFYTRRDA